MNNIEHDLSPVSWDMFTRLHVHNSLCTVLDAMLTTERNPRRGDDEPLNMVFEGSSGAGKSSALDIFCSRLDSLFPHTRDSQPYLRVTILGPANVGWLTALALEGLGEGVISSKGNIGSRTKRIINGIRERNVRILLFDEVNEFTDKGSAYVDQTLVSWTKTIVDSSPVGTVLCGLSGCRRIIDTDIQMKRRFPTTLQLDALRWDWASKSSKYREYMQWVVDYLQIPGADLFLEQHIAARFRLATMGLVGLGAPMLKLLRTHHLEGRLERLTLETLHAALDNDIHILVSDQKPFSTALSDKRAIDAAASAV